MQTKAGRHNLIAVLDWGIGHASRSIALAEKLEAGGEKITFASAGAALEMLRKERPDITCHELPAYHIDYRSSNMYMNIGRQLPKILRVIAKEKQALQVILKTNQYDRLISDSRFGCHSKDLPCIFLTHQLQPIFGLPLIDRLYRAYLRSKFSESWVPDYSGLNRLSGKLSALTGYRKVHFIGPLSRLSLPDPLPAKTYDLVALLSGPEPQRTYLENELIRILSSQHGQFLLISGKPGAGNTLSANLPDHIQRISYTCAEQTAHYLLSAKTILCRSGYSTLMDLDALGIKKNIALVPTPGQTEQLYLAKRMSTSSEDIHFAEQKDLATLLTILMP